MEDEIKTWLADIKQAIVEINDFLPDQKSFFNLKKILKQNVPLKGMLKLLEKLQIA